MTNNLEIALVKNTPHSLWTFAAVLLSVGGTAIFAVTSAAQMVAPSAAAPVEPNLWLRLADAGAGYVLAGLALVLTYRLAIQWATDARSFGEERARMLDRVLLVLTDHSKNTVAQTAAIEDVLDQIRRSGAGSGG